MRGIAEIGPAWAEFLSAWEDYRVEPEEFLEVDGERILVLINIAGRGRASGLEVGEMRAEAANLIDVRDGKVTRLALYWSRELAFADAGLPSASSG